MADETRRIDIGFQGGQVLPARVKQAAYDTAYEQFLRTPAGPARISLARKMSDISQAYMPMILHTYGVGNVLYYPWLQGYWPSK